MFKKIKADLNAVIEKDPAARNKLEVILTYSGFKALLYYRAAHWFYGKKLKLIARMISQRARHRTGIEIHPAAKIGSGIFIDHGMGVVIGETAEIGDDVVIYQGVTLGGTGKDTGKRHPTVGDDVMISSGSKVLGPITIGAGSKIGANSVVLKNVPPQSTVVGVPGRIVRYRGTKVGDPLDQIKLPDPVIEEFRRISKRLETIELATGIESCKYSISTEEENSAPEYWGDNI
ncbi:MAG: serine O-acetyltransferase [Clostridiales bacterium]|jgi:serine O-acetyltransferase|nr:serine O-acetyltransferase [Clostridiales bacterium]